MKRKKVSKRNPPRRFLFQEIKIKIPKEIKKRLLTYKKFKSIKGLTRTEHQLMNKLINNKFLDFKTTKEIIRAYNRYLKRKDKQKVKSLGGYNFCKKLKKICDMK